jgi:hypothetical protein
MHVETGVQAKFSHTPAGLRTCGYHPQLPIVTHTMSSEGLRYQHLALGVR